ncbi:DUF7563 family protein [Halorubrum sp. DTA98]|uniref:DUF7563 family protein n=1 Tax=Halorubrum sp. DTA98 TaxID=3402163 RepID=UPI003AADED48
MIRLQSGSGHQRNCDNCGCHVSDRFAAVYGDGQDQVHRCFACDCFRRITRGSAAGDTAVRGGSD